MSGEGGGEGSGGGTTTAAGEGRGGAAGGEEVAVLGIEAAKEALKEAWKRLMLLEERLGERGRDVSTALQEVTKAATFWRECDPAEKEVAEEKEEEAKAMLAEAKKERDEAKKERDKAEKKWDEAKAAVAAAEAALRRDRERFKRRDDPTHNRLYCLLWELPPFLSNTSSLAFPSDEVRSAHAEKKVDARSDTSADGVEAWLETCTTTLCELDGPEKNLIAPVEGGARYFAWKRLLMDIYRLDVRGPLPERERCYTITGPRYSGKSFIAKLAVKAAQIFGSDNLVAAYYERPIGKPDTGYLSLREMTAVALHERNKLVERTEDGLWRVPRWAMDEKEFSKLGEWLDDTNKRVMIVVDEAQLWYNQEKERVASLVQEVDDIATNLYSLFVLTGSSSLLPQLLFRRFDDDQLQFLEKEMKGAREARMLNDKKWKAGPNVLGLHNEEELVRFLDAYHYLPELVKAFRDPESPHHEDAKEGLAALLRDSAGLPGFVLERGVNRDEHPVTVQRGGISLSFLQLCMNIPELRDLAISMGKLSGVLFSSREVLASIPFQGHHRETKLLEPSAIVRDVLGEMSGEERTANEAKLHQLIIRYTDAGYFVQDSTYSTNNVGLNGQAMAATAIALVADPDDLVTAEQRMSMLYPTGMLAAGPGEAMVLDAVGNLYGLTVEKGEDRCLPKKLSLADESPRNAEDLVGKMFKESPDVYGSDGIGFRETEDEFIVYRPQVKIGGLGNDGKVRVIQRPEMTSIAVKLERGLPTVLKFVERLRLSKGVKIVHILATNKDVKHPSEFGLTPASSSTATSASSSPSSTSTSSSTSSSSEPTSPSSSSPPTPPPTPPTSTATPVEWKVLKRNILLNALPQGAQTFARRLGMRAWLPKVLVEAGGGEEVRSGDGSGEEVEEGDGSGEEVRSGDGSGEVA